MSDSQSSVLPFALVMIATALWLIAFDIANISHALSVLAGLK